MLLQHDPGRQAADGLHPAEEAPGAEDGPDESHRLAVGVQRETVTRVVRPGIAEEHPPPILPGHPRGGKALQEREDVLERLGAGTPHFDRHEPAFPFGALNRFQLAGSAPTRCDILLAASATRRSAPPSRQMRVKASGWSGSQAWRRRNLGVFPGTL